jgi:hypothetical protein
VVQNIDKIRDAVIKLEDYILRGNYRGYDPFDALTSPLFSLPIFRSNKIARLGAQQVLKRLPINFRQCLAIRKGYNPVTFGLCLQAFTYLREAFNENKEFYEEQIQFLVGELVRLQSKGYSGACWGYDFDWEARYSKIPAYMPTVVATGIMSNALFENYRITGNKSSFELCESASHFILKDLRRTYEDDTFCFSYSPMDREVVYNATMKGARLLAQVYSVTKAPELKEVTRNTVRFAMKNQKTDGSWRYSKGDAQTWVDNFHTGYILDCLDEYIKSTGDKEFQNNLAKGINFYITNFLKNNEIPKYYNNSVYPVDSTAAAQTILTLTRFGFADLAVKIALWMINNMQDKRGFFYYQKHRFHTNKIPYMRWSNAWMFTALAYLLRNLEKTND